MAVTSAVTIFIERRSSIALQLQESTVTMKVFSVALASIIAVALIIVAVPTVQAEHNFLSVPVTRSIMIDLVLQVYW